MLSNHFSPKAFIQYRKSYLKNFTDDTSEAFDFTVNNYIKSNQLFISQTDQDNYDLGLIVLPKTIVSGKQEYSGCLIYGLVASDQAKGTGILKKYFPTFLQQISSQYDVVLIQADHWKIYQDYPFVDVSEMIVYQSDVHQDQRFFAHETFSIDLASSMLSIYEHYLANFGFQNYVKYDLASFSKFLQLSFLNKDVVYLVPGAYTVCDPINLTCNSVAFASLDCLKNLLTILPKNAKIVLNKIINTKQITSLRPKNTFILTKQLQNIKKSLNPLIFNDVN